MAIQKTDKIWHNGKLINWDDATIHVMSHVIHYGSSVFEGIRCYELPSGPAIFRADEHMQRLLDSAKVYRIDVDFTRENWSRRCSTRSAQWAWPCYVRPMVLRGYGEAGVNPLNCPVEVYIVNYPWGKYLSGEVDGVRRLRFVVDAAGAEYSAGDGQGGRELHELAADQDGSDPERLRGRDRAGCRWIRQRRFGGERVSGASRQADHGAAGEFGAAGDHAGFGAADCARPEHSGGRADDSAGDAVHRGRSVLHGDRGGGTPIRSVDKIKVGKGTTGRMTKAMQKEFFAIVRGEKTDRYRWLTPVPVEARRAANSRSAYNSGP